MPRYKIKLVRETHYEAIIEADDEDAAADEAIERVESGEVSGEVSDTGIGEATVQSIEEIEE